MELKEFDMTSRWISYPDVIAKTSGTTIIITTQELTKEWIGLDWTDLH